MPTPTNTNAFKKQMYSYGSSPFRRTQIKAMVSKFGGIRKDNWMSIVSYLNGCGGFRKSICVGCGKGVLYDNNKKEYPISRKQTLEEVKTIVEEIRNINQNL